MNPAQAQTRRCIIAAMRRPARRILIFLAVATVGASACYNSPAQKRDDKKADDKKADDKEVDAKPTSPEPGDDAQDAGSMPPPNLGERGDPVVEGQALGGPVTSEVTLLRYQHWSDAPEFCRTPTKLLAHLDDTLSSDDCEAQRVSLRGREQLLLSCFSPVEAESAGAGGCEIEYAGTLRTLRASSSETDYTLVGQGNLSRVCRTSDDRVRTSAAELADVRAQRQAARRLEQQLQPCRQP